MRHPSDMPKCSNCGHPDCDHAWEIYGCLLCACPQFKKPEYQKPDARTTETPANG